MTTIALFAAGLAAAALAPDPARLVLQKVDFPPGTVATPNQAVRGARASFSTVYFNLRVGSREEEVSAEVFVARTAADAESIYRQTVGAYTGEVVPIRGETVLKLPRYGDEQYADFVASRTRSHAQAIVREKKVVWYLSVENCGVYAPQACSFGRTPPQITSAQAVPELRKYAAKQQRRIANAGS